MALIRNLKQKPKNNFKRLAIKICLSFMILLTIAIGGTIFYFNGNNIKEPLLKILNERSETRIKFANVEFSPLYPDTVKIHDLQVGDTKIKELYIEYDVKEVLRNNSLIIKDLYARDIKSENKDFEKILKNQLGFKNIHIKSLNLVDFQMQGDHFFIPKANLELKELISEQGILNYKDAKLYANEGIIFDESFKNANFEFCTSKDKIKFTYFSLKVLGGNLNGQGYFDKKEDCLELDVLNASNIILKDEKPLAVTIKAKEANLENISVELKNNNFYLGGLRGKAYNLKIDNHNYIFDFDGFLDEISQTNYQITLDSSKVKAILNNETLSFNSKGMFSDGKYEIDLEFDRLNQNLNVNTLNLTNVKIEPTSLLISQLEHDLQKFSTNFSNINLNNLSFISHINSLPLSIKNFDANLNDLSFSPKQFNKPLMLQLKAQKALFADLYFDNLTLIGNISDDLLNITVSDLSFKKSSLNFTISYAKKNQFIYLLANARNFDLTEINCSLIPHLMAGKIDLYIDLNGKLNEFGDLSKANGKIEITSDNILISRLGLDLINGGKKEKHIVSLDKLLLALSDADVGISKPFFEIKFKDNLVKANLKGETASLKFHSSVTALLDKKTLNGIMHLVSLAQDSTTVVKVKGSFKNPIFEIEAISRGEDRLGLTFLSND